MKTNKMLLAAAFAAMMISCGGGGIQDVEIRPKTSGFLTQICVKEGQAVQAGQVLFIIDNQAQQM